LPRYKVKLRVLPFICVDARLHRRMSDGMSSSACHHLK
jgi:hypothetical protein